MMAIGMASQRQASKRMAGNMQVELPPWPQFALFMAAVLVVSAFVITAAGQFPREHRKPALASPEGTIILWLTIAVMSAAGIAAMAFAWAVLPWYAVVIGAGLMILIAPYLLHPLPDWFINGRSSLVVLCALAIVLVISMWWTT
jgi:hypothetical protein